MNNILTTIAARTKDRVEEQKRQVPLTEVIISACNQSYGKMGVSFEETLRQASFSFICEVKKASPSRGVLDGAFSYLEIARDYEKSGATAISVITEPYWFLGANRYLKEIKEAVNIPVLRKDFTVDSYQIYESKVLGADAILLICSILTQQQLREYIQMADEIGLSALVETHSKKEIQNAIEAGARIIGVNNRDLRTMEVNLNTTIRLGKYVPKDVLFISESGIASAEDINRLKACGVNGVLVGETLMKSRDKKQRLLELRGGG